MDKAESKNTKPVTWDDFKLACEKLRADDMSPEKVDWVIPLPKSITYHKRKFRRYGRRK